MCFKGTCQAIEHIAQHIIETIWVESCVSLFALCSPRRQVKMMPEFQSAQRRNSKIVWAPQNQKTLLGTNIAKVSPPNNIHRILKTDRVDINIDIDYRQMER